MAVLERLLDTLSLPNVIFLSTLLVLFYSGVSRFQHNRRIKALGERATHWRHWLPLGIDFVFTGVREQLRNKNVEFWENGFEKYARPGTRPGTLEANAGGMRMIVTVDPENIKAVLATQFNDFGKGQNFNDDWYDFLGDSIFSTDHGKWHSSRQLLRPQFIKDRVSDLAVFEHNLSRMIARLGGQGQTVDIADLLFKFSLDASTHFLLGRGVDSLVNPRERFSEAFCAVQKIQSLRTRAGHFKIFIPKTKAYYADMKVINEFIDPFIDQVLTLSADELAKFTKSDTDYTFLHALAEYTRDRHVLRDQIIGILLAGRDTTASTLSWLFFELCNAPHIVAKLRDEIKQFVGLDRPPTYADLKDMKYLQHCLNETLRLYPAVPFNVREALKDTTLPRGGGPSGEDPIGVLKDTPIAYSTLIMQHREDLYPPQSSGFPPVKKFVPERWDVWTPKSWTYIPFNGGPRICIGQQFALTEMAYTVVRVFQRFKSVESRLAGRVPARMTDITIQPDGGVQVAFWDEDGLDAAPTGVGADERLV